jgi:hypothetical protein
MRNGPAPRLAYAHPVVPGHSAFAAEEGPAFQALFRNDAKSHSALSPAVRELWGSQERASRGAKIAAAPGSIGEPLDLLGHLRGNPLHAGRRAKLGS